MCRALSTIAEFVAAEWGSNSTREVFRAYVGITEFPPFEYLFVGHYTSVSGRGIFGSPPDLGHKMIAYIRLYKRIAKRFRWTCRNPRKPIRAFTSFGYAALANLSPRDGLSLTAGESGTREIF